MQVSLGVRKALLAAASTFLCIALIETGLRMRGVRWQPVVVADEPTMHEPDPVRGWRNKTGLYRVSLHGADAGGSGYIRVTIRPDGTRATSSRPDADAAGRSVVLLGGSFTQGWAVSDRETYAWKLHDAFPHTPVLNYGSGAYGTYQSLLTLRHHLAVTPSPPKLVLYGFVQHHELRNVGDPRWLRYLTRFTRRGHLELPYCVLGTSESLECHAPQRYGLKCLDETSSILYLARGVWTWRSSGPRIAQAEEVTRRLLSRMGELAASSPSHFAVVLLNATPRKGQRYIGFLRGEGIDVIDCRMPDMFRDEYIVAGDGHPNGKLHGLWADCLVERLGAILREP